MTFADLHDVPLILLDTPSVRTRLLPSIQAAGVDPQVVWGSQSLETVRSLVARGHGVSVLMQRPLTNITYDGRVVVPKPLNEQLEDGLGVYVAYPAQGHLSRRLRAIIGLFVTSQGLRNFGPPETQE